MRAELRSLRVTIAVNGRDEAQLVKQGLQEENEMPSIDEVFVVRRALLLQRSLVLDPILAMIRRFDSVLSTSSGGKKQRSLLFLS